MAEDVSMIPISKIKLTVTTLMGINTEAVEDLMISIKRYGIVKPIIVEKCGNGYYKLIDGAHRLYCANKLGLMEAPAHIITEEENKALTEKSFNKNLS